MRGWRLSGAVNRSPAYWTKVASEGESNANEGQKTPTCLIRINDFHAWIT